MKTTSTLRIAIVAIVLLASASSYAGGTVAAFAAAGTAAQPCGQTTELSGLDGRIAEKANQGVGALRQFIWITRGIYALDMADTVARLDQQRSARAACTADASSVASR